MPCNLNYCDFRGAVWWAWGAELSLTEEGLGYKHTRGWVNDGSGSLAKAFFCPGLWRLTAGC